MRIKLDMSLFRQIKENIMMGNIKYIYNFKQADYFMKHGAVCIGTGLNTKSYHYYWQFEKDNEKTQKCYDLWEKDKDNVLDKM